MSKFKIVVLESFIDCPNDLLAKDMLAKILELKLFGYRHSYQNNYLPISTQDFFCDHLIVCVEKKDELWPVSAFRTVTLEKCEKHNEKFPIIATFDHIGKNASKHKTEAMKIIGANKEPIYYGSSLTALPEYRGDKELADIIVAINVLFHMEKKASIVFGAGADKFKMHRYYYSWGYKDLGDKKLPSLVIPHLDNSLASFYYCDQFSDSSKATALKLQSLWDDRIIIDKDRLLEKKKAA